MPFLPERLLQRGVDFLHSNREKVEKSNFPKFLEQIKRSDIRERLTPQSPWAYFSAEVYDSGNYGLKGSGGLGVLAGDIIRQAEKIGMPFVAVTPFYPKRWEQRLTEDFWQEEDFFYVHPLDYGYIKEPLEIQIYTNGDTVPIEIYRKGSVLSLYDPNLGEVYTGNNNCEHRLYQQVVAGFGGMKALLGLGLSPSIIHLNESAETLAAVAYLDNLCQKGKSFEEALALTKNKTILTNHTLVPAANSCFSKEDYEKYVYKNIQTPQVKQWISQMMDRKSGQLSLETLALEMAGRFNGVSRLHAKIASDNFHKLDGSSINFFPITNGFSFDRWIYPKLLALYRQRGIIDEFDLPSENYRDKIDSLSPRELLSIEYQAKRELLGYLATRINQHVDQYHQPIIIPPDAVIAGSARRIGDYKRTGMPFENPDRFAQILREGNTHYIFSGLIHPDDYPMKKELQRILEIIHNHPVLLEYAHFAQGYDDKLAPYLLNGVDFWNNMPRKGEEACGTSWAMAVGNRKPVVSTRDGGVADLDECPLLEITGKNYKEEVESYYQKFEKATKMARHPQERKQFVDSQLEDYLSILSGGGMIARYLEFAWPTAN